MLDHPTVEAIAARALQCPDCGLPTTITDRFTLHGSPEPVEHIALVCVAGHRFTPPTDSLPDRLREPCGADASIANGGQ